MTLRMYGVVATLLSVHAQFEPNDTMGASWDSFVGECTCASRQSNVCTSSKSKIG